MSDLFLIHLASVYKTTMKGESQMKRRMDAFDPQKSTLLLFVHNIICEHYAVLFCMF